MQRWRVLWISSGCSTVLDTEAHTLGDHAWSSCEMCKPSRQLLSVPPLHVSMRLARSMHRAAPFNPCPPRLHSFGVVPSSSPVSPTSPPSSFPATSSTSVQRCACACPCRHVADGVFCGSIAAAVAPSSIPRRTHSGTLRGPRVSCASPVVSCCRSHLSIPTRLARRTRIV